MCVLLIETKIFHIDKSISVCTVCERRALSKFTTLAYCPQPYTAIDCTLPQSRLLALSCSLYCSLFLTVNVLRFATNLVSSASQCILKLNCNLKQRI